MAGRLEINFKRLLSRCENISSSKDKSDWRLDKYVAELSRQLTELRKAPGRPTQEVLTEYTCKVEFLKGILETEKLESKSEKVVAADLLAPASSSHTSANRELQLHTKAQYQREARDELLGIDSKSTRDETNGLRHRGVSAQVEGDTEDLDAVIKYHNQQQEKLAEEMLMLARSMKENAKVANRIVLEDNKKLGESLKLADSNYGKLKVESEKLEKHVAKSCNWWIWVMLVLVCITFVWMVLFMKMFPKR